MIGTEIGEGEEEAADDARPKRVALVGIEGKVDRLKFAKSAGDRERMSERQLRVKSIDDDEKSNGHPDQDDHHLVALGQANDLRPAATGVDDDESAREPDGQVQSPAEQSGKNDGRSVNRDARGKAALDEKEKSAQELRLSIEPLPEILVGGVRL